ncbi:hypothetical protein [Arcanobacterium hippocoleae]
MLPISFYAGIPYLLILVGSYLLLSRVRTLPVPTELPYATDSAEEVQN